MDWTWVVCAVLFGGGLLALGAALGETGEGRPAAPAGGRVSPPRAVPAAARAGAAAFGVSFVLNLVWETAQAPLYQGYTDFASNFGLCFVASIGDAAFTTALYLALALAHRDALWVRRRTARDALATVAAGLVAAVVGERISVGAGWWSYSRAMPTVPVVEVGLTPFLQLAVLALVTFEVVRLTAANAGPARPASRS